MIIITNDMYFLHFITVNSLRVNLNTIFFVNHLPFCNIKRSSACQVTIYKSSCVVLLMVNTYIWNGLICQNHVDLSMLWNYSQTNTTKRANHVALLSVYPQKFGPISEKKFTINRLFPFPTLHIREAAKKWLVLIYFG